MFNGLRHEIFQSISASKAGYSYNFCNVNEQKVLTTKNNQNSESSDFLPPDDQHLHGNKDGQRLDGVLQEHHHVSDDLWEEEENDTGGTRGH